MPTLKTVKAKIEKVEGFQVVFKSNGVSVRSDKENIPQYPYERAAPGSWSIAEWSLNRFNQTYPGYGVEVLSKTGLPVAGNTKLDNIR